MGSRQTFRRCAWPITRAIGSLSYREKIIRGAENAMGAGPFSCQFKGAWRGLFRRGIEEGLGFTNSGIYRMFIDYTPADKVAGVKRVFARFHGDDFLEQV